MRGSNVEAAIAAADHIADREAPAVEEQQHREERMRANEQASAECSSGVLAACEIRDAQIRECGLERVGEDTLGQERAERAADSRTRHCSVVLERPRRRRSRRTRASVATHGCRRW
jgi:hypothetical protein